jgi:hypothetical protein
MTRSTGPLQYYRIIPTRPASVLQMPPATPLRACPTSSPSTSSRDLQGIQPLGPHPRVNTVGRLNEIIAANEIKDFVKVAEALHEKRSPPSPTRSRPIRPSSGSSSRGRRRPARPRSPSAWPSSCA